MRLLGGASDCSGQNQEASGAVVNGWHRDTPQVLEQNFPVFCTQCWAQDSSVRTYVCDYRCTIEIGQVTIHDGDLVFGDIDGVLIIPAEVKDEVIEKASLRRLERRPCAGPSRAACRLPTHLRNLEYCKGNPGA